jgi:hypothetical protein
MANGYEIRGVLAAAYEGKQEQRACLLHVLFDGADRTACGRVLEEKLCDVSESRPVTCTACLRKLEKATRL